MFFLYAAGTARLAFELYEVQFSFEYFVQLRHLSLLFYRFFFYVSHELQNLGVAIHANAFSSEPAQRLLL